jgi:hypothetical protein
VRSWFFPQRATEAIASRSAEASIEQLVATGAAGWGVDPVDGDVGYRLLGVSNREVPAWTLEKARAYSIAAYRMNPMARAILDTFTSFCVGDSGLSLQCTNPEVREVAEAFWRDPANRLGEQDLWLRSHMLWGELAVEPMTGSLTGATRLSIIDPTRVAAVELLGGNVLWPASLVVRSPDGADQRLEVVHLDDLTGRRTGDVLWWASWKALLTDRRGFPFLGPVLDDLDSYDQVLSNLVDRTALARYLVLDVTLTGADDNAIEGFIRQRGGRHVPRSGTIEVHNENVRWDVKQAEVGSAEDATTAKSILTKVAGGAGLARTWLADPEDANRATSLTMAEPVRRRVGGVQNLWLAVQTELVRHAVDQAVAAGRIPARVPTTTVGGGQRLVPASETVTITGPEIAAADAQVTAAVLVQLSQAMTAMILTGVLSQDAARLATRKAWEQFVGIPYTADLDRADGSTVDDIAGLVDQLGPGDTKLALKL